MIVARGASDDKGQVMTFIEACRALIETRGGLPVDVTVFLEGEEESSSRSLVPFLTENREELKADFCLVCDTGLWDRDTPAITTMLRGIVYEEVKIKAASMDLHSGILWRRGPESDPCAGADHRRAPRRYGPHHGPRDL